MAAICGIELSRRAEQGALLATIVAVVLAVLAPVLYAVALGLACGGAAAAAPSGRRAVTALAAWVPVSTAVVVGLAPIS